MKYKKEAVIASGNQHKIQEFKQMLEPLGFKVYSMKEMNINGEVEETGTDFPSNALLKAKYVAQFVKDKIVFADDSGLEIHALNGFPGIYSHRFMEDKSYKEKNEAIIKKLEGIENKDANYTCAIALVNFNGKEDKVFVGKTQGYILDKIDGEGGFGYDPIFYSYELNKSFGKATPEEKNSISHRSKALKQMMEYIKNNLD